MNCKVKLDKHKNRLVLTGTKIQSINIREMNEINGSHNHSIIRLSCEKDKPPVRLVADVSGLTNLSEYLSHTIITKKLFSNLVRDIVQVIQDGESIKFNRSLFVFDIDYVFIEPASFTVLLTYVPLQPYSTDGSLSELFTQIVQKATFDSSEETTYISDFLKIIKQQDISLFVLHEYLNYISEKVVDKDDKEKTITCPHCNSKISNKTEVCDYCGYQINKRRQHNSTSTEDGGSEKNPLIINEDPSGVVTVFRASAKRIFFLIDDISQKSVEITHSPFRIGKLLDTSDYRIENEAVSRKHAEIIVELDRCYIVDLYSKNGTFVNGKRISGGIKEEIKDGDVIQFANSSFTFKGGK